MVRDNKDTFYQLREQFPVFTYRSYSFSKENDLLNISFDFDLSGKFTFKPTLKLHLKGHSQWQFPDDDALDNLVFHIGLIELISYWKLSCAPKLVIEPFSLDSHQISFWKKIYYNGLGEFFYTNSIQVSKSEFLTIECKNENSIKKFSLQTESDQLLVPVGGGKDSNVSLELLKKDFKLIPFIVNPRLATLESAKEAGFTKDQIFIVDRKLDPLLLELNGKGFLNGHTPFSALLGFVSLLAATISRSRYIVLSNESSANEPTVKDGPNHQYSKSFEFEKDLRSYVKNFVSDQIEYFSFLRPLSELQIASIFSQNPKYFPKFKSCNVGSKTDSWCGNCPKCLFTYIILSPFINKEELQNIFGSNLFENQKLLPVLDELTGISPIKPFECVGTVDEVNLTLSVATDIYPKPLAFLLDYFQKSGKYISGSDALLKEQLRFLEPNHFVPPPFYKILTRALNV